MKVLPSLFLFLFLVSCDCSPLRRALRASRRIQKQYRKFYAHVEAFEGHVKDPCSGNPAPIDAQVLLGCDVTPQNLARRLKSSGYDRAIVFYLSKDIDVIKWALRGKRVNTRKLKKLEGMTVVKEEVLEKMLDAVEDVFDECVSKKRWREVWRETKVEDRLVKANALFQGSRSRSVKCQKSTNKAERNFLNILKDIFEENKGPE